jgi:hypothetical protein
MYFVLCRLYPFSLQQPRQRFGSYTVKKVSNFLSPAGMSPNSHQTLPGRGLVSDIPAGDGKTTNIFFQCTPSSLYLYRRCWLVYPYDGRDFVGPKRQTTMGLLVLNPLRLQPTRMEEGCSRFQMPNL